MAPPPRTQRGRALVRSRASRAGKQADGASSVGGTLGDLFCPQRELSATSRGLAAQSPQDTRSALIAVTAAVTLDVRPALGLQAVSRWR